MLVFKWQKWRLSCGPIRRQRTGAAERRSTCFLSFFCTIVMHLQTASERSEHHLLLAEPIVPITKPKAARREQHINAKKSIRMIESATM